jgi:hypothetical protein
MICPFVITRWATRVELRTEFHDVEEVNRDRSCTPKSFFCFIYQAENQSSSRH